MLEDDCMDDDYMEIEIHLRLQPLAFPTFTNLLLFLRTLIVRVRLRQYHVHTLTPSQGLSTPFKTWSLSTYPPARAVRVAIPAQKDLNVKSLPFDIPNITNVSCVSPRRTRGLKLYIDLSQPCIHSPHNMSKPCREISCNCTWASKVWKMTINDHKHNLSMKLLFT